MKNSVSLEPKPNVLDFHSILLVSISRSNITPTDVGKCHRGLRMLCLNQSRISLGTIARTSVTTIQPTHKLTGVIPDTEDQNHSPTESVAHLLQTAHLLEVAGGVLTKALGN